MKIESPSANGFLIYLHIQKTAGITVQRLLRRKMGRSIPARAMGLFVGQSQGVDTLSALKAKRFSDRYFVGHICYGVHKHLPTPNYYAAFLRDPVDRLISLYKYSNSNPTAYYHAYAKDRSIEEFLLDSGLMELDNGMTRFIAGSDSDLFINRTPIGNCGEDLLEKAKENIRNSFVTVGITERFDESILVLAKILGWRNAYYFSRNRASAGDGEHHKRGLASDQLRQTLEEKNSLDRRLYSFAQSKLDEQIESLDGDFEATLSRFQRRNQLFQKTMGPFFEFYSNAKNRFHGKGTPH